MFNLKIAPNQKESEKNNNKIDVESIIIPAVLGQKILIQWKKWKEVQRSVLILFFSLL